MPNYFLHQSGPTEPISVTHNPLNDPSALQTDQNAPRSSRRDHNPEPGPSGLQSVSIELQTPPRMNVNADTDTEYSPRKMLIKKITKVLSPEETEDIQKAKKNQSQPRKRIQAKRGEILTEADCIERFRQEEAARNTKIAKGKGVKGKPGLAKNSKPKSKSGLKDVESQSPKDNPASITVTAASAPNRIISDSDSKEEIIRPRKPRRKLIASEVDKILAKRAQEEAIKELATAANSPGGSPLPSLDDGNKTVPAQMPIELEAESSQIDESNAPSDIKLVTPERIRRKVSSEDISNTSMGDSIIQTAWRKLIFLETSDIIQDFDHERLS